MFGQSVIGASVQWYPRANTMLNATPKVAIILACNDDGTSDLVVFEPSGGTNRVRGSHHKDSPGLFESGTNRLNGGAILNGCWDFSPFAKSVLAVADSLVLPTNVPVANVPIAGASESDESQGEAAPAKAANKATKPK